MPAIFSQLQPSDSAEMKGAKKARATVLELFESEEASLVRFAFGICGRRTAAEDVVQEAFISLHENYATIENPRAWLYRCTRNLSLNARRKSSREVVGMEEGTFDDQSDRQEAPDVELVRLEASGQLQLLIAELSERDQKVLRMKYFDDKSYREIAESLDMTVGNVGSCLHHILKGLAATLRRSGVAQDRSEG